MNLCTELLCKYMNKKVQDRKIHTQLLKTTSIFAFCCLCISNVSASDENVLTPNKESITLQQIKTAKVTMSISNKPLKEILIALCKEANVKYTIKSGVTINDKINYSLVVSNVSVHDALNRLLANSPYDYTIVNEIITIINRAQQQKKVETITVSGRVIDRNTKEPIVGATVITMGSGEGAITDDNGKFTYATKSNAKAEVSFIGYKAQIVPITNNMVIVMDIEAIGVDDVVVTGLLPRKQSGFAGTATKITKKDLQRVSTGNIFTTIAALDAGFKINENNEMGSSPNQLPDFTIRGKGSFQNGSTAPIFIVDGFEVSQQKVFDMDMNRIESITLLKDASATILYGSRASNGVIAIETVAPAMGKLTITYDFRPTIGVTDLSAYDLMNASEKLEYERLAGLFFDEKLNLAENQKLEAKYYEKYKNVARGVDTYWLKQPIRNAFSHAHSLNVSGGDNAVRYSIDAAYNQDLGVMKGSGRDRLSLGFNLTYRIKNKITFRNYASYGNVKSYESPYGAFSTYADLNPYELMRDSNGELLTHLSDETVNPLCDAGLSNKDTKKIEDFTEQFAIDWNIIENLRFRGQFNITKVNNKDEVYRSPYSSEYMGYDGNSTDFIPIAERGSLKSGLGESVNLSTNFTLNYNLMLKKHILYTGGGVEMRTSRSQLSSTTVTGFADDKYSDASFAIQYEKNSKAIGTEQNSRDIGFFGNINYIFDNRLFADFSFRFDGSSRFGSDKRFAPFWSIGAGWNLHNEKFMKGENHVINNFTLRASYGVTGNQEFSTYQARTMYQFKTDVLYYNSISAILMGYGNPNLKWQEQFQTNIGLDLSFFDNRLRANFNYYHKRTEGMLAEVTVAPSLGISKNSFTSNLGEIINRGYEINLNAVVMRKRESDLEWGISFQGSNNKNTLRKISNELKGINETNNSTMDKPLSVYEEGESMSALKAVRSLGIDPATGKELYLTKNGKRSFTWDAADKVICGDTEPVFFGNIGTNLYYKGFNLNIGMSYRLGADAYNETLSSRVEGANPKYNADRRVLRDRWKNVGDHAMYRNITDYSQTFVSTRFVQKENLLSMGNLSLTYDFSRELLKKIKFNTLRVGFYMNDLFRISTIKQERGTSYPFERSFVLNLNVSF